MHVRVCTEVGRSPIFPTNPHEHIPKTGGNNPPSPANVQEPLQSNQAGWPSARKKLWSNKVNTCKRQREGKHKHRTTTTFHQISLAVFQPPIMKPTQTTSSILRWTCVRKETKPTPRKSRRVVVKLDRSRAAANSCHDGYMFTRLNTFLKELHVDCQVDPPCICLLEIIGRWFPAGKRPQVIPDGCRCGFGPIWTSIVQKRAWLNWSHIYRFLHIAAALNVKMPISHQEPAWSSVSGSYLGMEHPYAGSWLCADKQSRALLFLKWRWPGFMNYIVVHAGLTIHSHG